MKLKSNMMVTIKPVNTKQLNTKHLIQSHDIGQHRDTLVATVWVSRREHSNKNRKLTRQLILWNKLPVNVREADTLSTLKIRLKTVLSDKAYS